MLYYTIHNYNTMKMFINNENVYKLFFFGPQKSPKIATLAIVLDLSTNFHQDRRNGSELLRH